MPRKNANASFCIALYLSARRSGSRPRLNRAILSMGSARLLIRIRRRPVGLASRSNWVNSNARRRSTFPSDDRLQCDTAVSRRLLLHRLNRNTVCDNPRGQAEVYPAASLVHKSETLKSMTAQWDGSIPPGNSKRIEYESSAISGRGRWQTGCEYSACSV